jgi:hypothetical protein
VYDQKLFTDAKEPAGAAARNVYPAGNVVALRVSPVRFDVRGDVIAAGDSVGKDRAVRFAGDLLTWGESE